MSLFPTAQQTDRKKKIPAGQIDATNFVEDIDAYVDTNGKYIISRTTELQEICLQKGAVYDKN